jgi:hypothetical protein
MTESERRMVQIAGKRTVSLRNQAITLIDVPKGAVLHQKQVNECNGDVSPVVVRTLALCLPRCSLWSHTRAANRSRVTCQNLMIS